MRVQIHNDRTQIKDLGDKIIEADTTIDSLTHKAKYSNKMEEERRKMVKVRSILLYDLCSAEKIKHRKHGSIALSGEKEKLADTITSKIRHKMFAFNGNMKKRSPDKYTRRESMIAQYSRKKLERAGSKLGSSQNFKKYFAYFWNSPFANI